MRKPEAQAAKLSPVSQILMRSSCDPNARDVSSVSNPHALPGTSRSAQATFREGLERIRSPDAFIMLDIVFIAAGLAFFGVAAGYALVCERL
ncbi:hypothetical protein GCM10007884_45020 [Methylobacterium brachythecii]|uniref:Uncharacterized protein n=1 Tax=Methylobacterium brachythecii TaxID=1176177 RepID=A0ABQ6DE06_9HYPH|nr:hypothetical protein GCM10007884_45020 [Methylobacterium brachythecii]